MELLLGAASNFVDVGANKGEILCHACRLAPSGVHFAVEPSPHYAALLRKRFPLVTVIEAAAGNDRGRAQFGFRPDAPARSSLAVPGEASAETEYLDVALLRLDEIFGPETRVDFIKVDVEGSEFDVLRGASAVVERCRPVLLVESNKVSAQKFGVSAVSIWNLVQSWRYVVFTLPGFLAAEDRLTQMAFNAIWDNGSEDYFVVLPVERCAKVSAGLDAG